MKAMKAVKAVKAAKAAATKVITTTKRELPKGVYACRQVGYKQTMYRAKQYVGSFPSKEAAEKAFKDKICTVHLHKRHVNRAGGSFQAHLGNFYTVQGAV